MARFTSQSGQPVQQGKGQMKVIELKAVFAHVHTHTPKPQQVLHPLCGCLVKGVIDVLLLLSFFFFYIFILFKIHSSLNT